MKRRLFVAFGVAMLFGHMALTDVHGQSLRGEDLVGIWRSNVQTPYGPAQGEVILKPDGTFSKTFRCGGLFTLDVGRYTVGAGFIHFTIQDHEPKTYMNKPMTWVTSETWFFQFLGSDQIQFEDRVVGTRWEAHRVR